jgi:3-oxoadipate enol-lactonase
MNRGRHSEVLIVHPFADYKKYGEIQFLDPNPNGKPAVLLLHGLGVDGSSWGFQLAGLVKAGFRPIAPDLPGFGRSSYDGQGWSMRRTSEQMSALLSHMGVVEAGVVGLSLGGAIALMIALNDPGRIRHLVLINTFACLRPRRFNELVYLLRRFMIANLRGIEYQAEMVARRLFPGAEEQILRQELIQRIIQSDPRVYRGAMRALGLFDLRKRLIDIRVPTTVITAENDTTVSREIQNELAMGIPGARHVIVPNSGHAVIIDQPDLINEVLIDILTRD